MLKLKLWQRALFTELICFSLLFMLGFYLLYVCIDYAIHLHNLSENMFELLGPLAQYYLLQLIKRLGLILPLALMLGTIKVLFRMNVHKELLALQTSGIRRGKILSPFFATALLGSVVLFLSNEYLLPLSGAKINQFERSYLKNPNKKKIFAVGLKDHAQLLYQSFDPQKGQLFDTTWILGIDELWKIKYLTIEDEKGATGLFVDHIVRDETGKLQRIASFSSYSFPDLILPANAFEQNLNLIDTVPISKLWKWTREFEKDGNPKEDEILSHLLFKLSTLCLPFLVVAGVSSFCIQQEKKSSWLLLFGASLLSFVFLISYLNAAMLLGESGTLSPYFGLLFPLLALLTFFSIRLKKAV